MEYKIYPPIGIARVGNSDQFFVGPETPDSLGNEVDADGSESPVTEFKDQHFRVKRQAARFRIFQFPDEQSMGEPLHLPDGAVIKWTAHLANKKAAVRRTAGPPSTPRRPVLAKTKTARVLDGGRRSILGTDIGTIEFVTGILPVEDHPDYLGEMRTDQNQNLMILGGRGYSNGPDMDSWSFYTNDGWYDDVSDGPVEAEIQFPDGTSVQVEPAWIVVAPPDFAPGINAIVTLYDVIRQVGVDKFNLQTPAEPSFSKDIYPLLYRAHNLRWVNDIEENGQNIWENISTDYSVLADPTTAREIRQAIADVVSRPPLAMVNTRQFQKDILDQWVKGTFKSDWNGQPSPAIDITPEGLTLAALESCIGQGFYPGIEAGIIVEDPTLYSSPFDFRFSHNSLDPGNITALMAQPWQADFLKCMGGWWPSQRPGISYTTVGGPSAKWDRGINDHPGMVKNGTKLGVLTPPDHLEKQRQPEPWD